GCPATASGTLTCTLTGTLNPFAAAGSVTITLSRATTGADCGLLTNSASVSATNEPPANQGNNSSGPISITVNCPDVTVAKSGNGPINAGSTATFTLTVSNIGAGAATGVVVTDTLPAGTWTVGAPADAGCPATASGKIGRASCRARAPMAAAAAVTINLSRASTAADCGPLTNSVHVATTNEAPTALSNNDASASITVNCPDVQVVKSGNGAISARSTTTSPDRVCDVCSGAPTGVVVTDTLPAGTWTVSAPADAGCPATASGTLTCTFTGTLNPFAAAGSVTITLSRASTAADCGPLTNSVHVGATNEAPTALSNNDASASITVLCPT